MQSRCRESKCPCAGQSLRVPRAGASGTEASVHVSVCVCVCDLGVCACARETLGLWGQTWGGGSLRTGAWQTGPQHVLGEKVY